MVFYLFGVYALGMRQHVQLSCSAREGY